MSKKVAAAAVIMFVFGGISIPGGFFINNYIADLTYSSMDEGLLGIKDQGVPIVEESLYQMGPATALSIIKGRSKDASGPLANATIFMGQINTVEESSVGLGVVIEALFWDWFDGTPAGSPGIGFSYLASLVGYPPIKGISEWYGVDLNFTVRDATGADYWGGVDRLKYGINTTGWWGDRLPGIFEDTYDRVGDGDWPPDNMTDSLNTVEMTQDRGFGVVEMMDLIKSANETQIQEMAGPSGYNLSSPLDNFTYKSVNYTKLEILYFYYTDYFVVDVFNMILAQFNTEGSALWTDFPQYRPRDWNGNDTSYDDLAFYSVIEQWAKCLSYDDGTDLHDSEPKIPVGTYGLEPAGPGVDSGIPIQAALQLWNESYEYAIINFPTGIQMWYTATYDQATYNELLNEFKKYPGYDYENTTYGEFGWGFNETDMDLLLDWLWGDGGGWDGSFSEHLLPILIQANFDKSLADFSFHILLEQWANGTIMGYPLYPNGFALPLGFRDIYGFEIGYQGLIEAIIPTNMSLESALKLWDTSSDYSLVKKEGLQMWFAAINGDSQARNTLQSINGLEDGAMNLLLEWIPKFQQNVMPYLAQYQMGLPTDSITLGNIIQIAAIGLGGVCIGLGGVAITGNVVARRKRLAKKQIGTIDKSKLEEKGDPEEKYL